MTATAGPRSIDQESSYVALMQCGVAAVAINEGAMVCCLTSNGYAVKAGTGSTGAVQGVAKASVDNSGGSVGDLSIDLLAGVFWRANYSGNLCTQAHFGKVVYAKDDQTISNSSGDGPVAGICIGIDADLGVQFYCEPGLNYLLSQATLTSDLASVVNAKGASLVGLEDAGNFTLAATVEAAIAEILQDLKSAVATIPLDIVAFTKADGTALAKYSAANDGTCGIYGDGTKVLGVRWNNTAGATDTVAKTFSVPADCDLTVAPVIRITAAKTGATLGDATTFVCGMYAQTPAALYDAGANLGVTTGAMTGDAIAKTVQQVVGTLTVFPGLTSRMTLTVNPTAAKLGTDDVIITAAEIVYKRKPRTS